MNAIFSLSTARVNLGTALFFDSPHVSQQKRNDLFENMVQKNAEYCLSGDPEAGGTAEDHCIVLIGRVTSGLMPVRRWSVPSSCLGKWEADFPVLEGVDCKSGRFPASDERTRPARATLEGNA